MFTMEGSAVETDSIGNLLFYTNGRTVWNKNHDIMVNGDSLNGHESSTQSSLIVKQPESSSVYYLFTTDAQAEEHGLQYSIIDMDTDGGNGSVQSKNIKLIGHTSEKLTAIQHKNKKDYWILNHIDTTNHIYAYLLTNSGLNTSPIISKIGNISPIARHSNHGHIKANCRGDKLAVTHPKLDKIDVMDFDNSTGKLSNFIQLDPEHGSVYGVEFSPNGNLLYVSKTILGVYQFNLTLESEEKMNACKYKVFENSGFVGALQLGPDGAIYLSNHFSTKIDRIRYPNRLGEACGFEDNFMSLSNENPKWKSPHPFCLIGLPNFRNDTYVDGDSTFTFKVNCKSDSVEFIPENKNITDIEWTVNYLESGLTRTSSDLIPKLPFYEPGTYRIFLKAKYQGKWQSSSADLYIQPNVPIELPNDTIICSKNQYYIELDSTYNYVWEDGIEGHERSFFYDGDYIITAHGNCYCPTTDTLRITFEDCCDLYFPNVFTPNEDGINDILMPSSKCTFDYYQLKVYNKWGILLADLNENEPWDGKTGHTSCSPGVYFYTLEYRFVNAYYTKTKHGTFHLQR